ncbi:YadA family autotransporter adhesin [Cupriavidus necator]
MELQHPLKERCIAGSYFEHVPYGPIPGDPGIAGGQFSFYNTGADGGGTLNNYIVGLAEASGGSPTLRDVLAQGIYTNANTTLIQSSFGSSAGNPCANGGANAGNTVVTTADLTGLNSGTVMDANAVHYDADASGAKANDITLSGGSAGTVAIHNVSTGLADTDAANVGQVNAAAASALTQANAYTNAAVGNALSQASTYTDTATKYFKANSTGAAATASGTDAVSVGPNSVASGTSAVAMGNGAQATGAQSIAMGNGAKAQGLQSIAIGTGNVVSGNHSGAIGDPNVVSGNNSYALGNNNTVATDSTFVVGSGVTTTQTNSVVLGNASTDRAATTVTGTTINGKAYSFAGAGSIANGIVSVASVGAERQVINVAAGELSAISTDAVNGSQLHATNQAVNQLGTKTDSLGNSTAAALGGGTTYDPKTGTIAAPGYTINQVTYNNVGNAIDALGSAVAANNAGNLPPASATGANSVAIGAGSVAERPNTVSVGAAGSERQITNVAAGTAPTDAVNVNQLNTVAGQANQARRMSAAAGAMGAAMAAMQPNARAEGPLSISVGAGTYGGVAALAAGLNYYATNRVLLNLKASTALGGGLQGNQTYSVGVGATFGF